MSNHWQSLVDQLLQNAQQEGQFDDLPNQGQPLKFEDESHIPDDMRMANRIMKEHDVVPEWIALGKDIDSLRERLLHNMQRRVRAYRGALGDAERSSASFEKHQQAETTMRRAREAYMRAAAKLNREILRYNLKIPSGLPQRALFDLDKELDRLLNNNAK